MLTLAELCERAVEAKVMVRGKDCTVRPVSARRAARIRTLIPRPADAALHVAWYTRLEVVEAALGLDLAAGPEKTRADTVWNDDLKLLVWCEMAWQELGGLLTDAEITAINEAMRRAALGINAAEDARKNSSSPAVQPGADPNQV